MSIKTSLNHKPRSKLEQKVIDLIYDGVPLNLACQHCERDIDVNCVLEDTIGRWSNIEWDKLAREVIDAVKEHILAAVREEA